MGLTVTREAVSVPAEWAPQKAIWTAWPADPDEWNGDLASPRRDVAGLVRALARSNRVRLLVSGAEAEASARVEFDGAAEIVPARYGDIWLRDTGPIFARARTGAVALRFRTNGWGGKFDLPGDDTVGDDIARLAGTPTRRFDFVLEGGAVEHDGEGTILATRETLLNDNRNGWTEAEAEAALREAFGAKKIIWLDRGLLNDHTDGHIDTIARFVGPGRVVCQSPVGRRRSERRGAGRASRAALEAATDAVGSQARRDPHSEPGPGGERPGRSASRPRMSNFVIANDVVACRSTARPARSARSKRCRRSFPTARS